jgi:hypothetical protein
MRIAFWHIDNPNAADRNRIPAKDLPVETGRSLVSKNYFMRINFFVDTNDPASNR